MSGSDARLEAISAVTSYEQNGAAFNFVDTPTSEIFGASSRHWGTPLRPLDSRDFPGASAPQSQNEDNDAHRDRANPDR